MPLCFFFNKKCFHNILFHAPLALQEMEVMLGQKKKKKKKKKWSSPCGMAETNLTRNHEVVGSIPGLAQ